MKIMIVGLGLIGGSFAKALKRYTDHEIWGFDIDSKSLGMALDEGSIHSRASLKDLNRADAIVVALPVTETLRFLREYAPGIDKEKVLIDTCGVKRCVTDEMRAVMAAGGPMCIGMHPMAGRELYGYEHAVDNLFQGASLLVTPLISIPQDVRTAIRNIAHAIGFTRILVTTPLRHDRIIAYTSQLAHIVSSAYIKSPTMLEEVGFSAGSFRDMTRVAQLDEVQWRELMMFNRAALVWEIDILIDELKHFRMALLENNIDRLTELLKDGRERKEWSNLHAMQDIKDDLADE